MTKQRIQGRVVGDQYEVFGVDGAMLSRTPLTEARSDTRLAAAIKRNGWEAIPEA
jgi:hypothetical protein